MAVLVEDGARLRLVLDRVDGIAVLPHVVFKVLELSGSSDSSAQEMEKAITVDPGFSTKVLALANSAAFGLPRRVSSIREAVMFLGFRTVRSLAMTIGTFDMFVGKTDRESLRRRAWWRQSVDTAVAARWIARTSRCADPDEAYTCGLLHLIGKTLLDKCGGRDYELVTRAVSLGAPELPAERALFGCDHVQVSVGAAEKWGLPKSLLGGLNYREESAEFAGLCAATALGHALALIARGGVDASELPAWALRIAKINDVAEFTKAGTDAVVQAQLQI